RVVVSVTVGVRAAYQRMQSASRSVHADLEDAGRILGATRLRTLKDVTAPLLRTSVIATWCFIFVGVMRELSAAIILFTSETKVISVLIFDLKESGDLGAISVLGIAMLLITFAVVTAVNRIPGFGISHRRYTGSRTPLMDAKLPQTAVAEVLSGKIAPLDAARLPPAVRCKCEDLLVDVVGLCVTVRNEDYVKAAIAAWDDGGTCTAIGHARPMSAAGAAFVNGTATHGEDFDDTFEGGPVHAGAVIVPAVLAACERHRPDGRSALLGIAVGVETMCRLSLVAPTLT